ncbi:MAG: hypothetical protein JRF55_03375, partial [Deltaproteobacteria bacterium]|nr:hypothetical protein [Deltaproteobacteria bacterium]
MIPLRIVQYRQVDLLTAIPQDQRDIARQTLVVSTLHRRAFGPCAKSVLSHLKKPRKVDPTPPVAWGEGVERSVRCARGLIIRTDVLADVAP